jgi:hypothetical protein
VGLLLIATWALVNPLHGQIERTSASLPLDQAASFPRSAWPIQERVGPFHFHSDAPIQELASLVDQIGSLPSEVSEKTGIEPRAKKVHLVLMRSEADFRRYMQHYFPKAPARRALFIQDRGPGIVFTFRNPELIVDLRHECTHALLQDQLPGLPLWLDEGLAEFFEVAPSQQGYHQTHAAKTHRQTRMGHMPPLERLECLEQASQMGPDQYQEAWAWVHFLLLGPTRANALLQAFLKDTNQGLTPGPLSHRVRLYYPEYREEFLTHFSRLRSPESVVEFVSEGRASPSKR